MPVTNNSDSLRTRNLAVDDALTLGDDTPLSFQEMIAPPTPPSGSVVIYAKSDGKLYAKDDTGAETDLTAGVTAVHTHQDAANGGLLDTAAIGSGTLASARLAAKHRTITKIFYIEDPLASDSFPIAFVADNVTFVQVRAITNVGTVDFNIQRRSTNTPDVAGTDILSADLQATAASAATTSFASSGSVAAEQWLNYNASAIASAPTKLWIVLEYTID